MKNDYQANLEIKKQAKRIAITFLCTIPLLVIVALALGDKINSGVRIVIFVAILLTTFFIEETIYSKIKQNKPEKIKEHKEDVFK